MLKKLFESMKVFIMILISMFSIFAYGKQDIAENKTKIIIHYQKKQNLNWDLWVWPKDMEGREYKFTKKDKFGEVAEIELDKRVEKVGFIVRIPDWSKKDVDKDRYIDVKDGFAEIWLKSNDENVYTTNIDRILKPETNKTKLIIHYQKTQDLDWDLWVWPKDMGGREYKFDDEDSFGLVSEIVLEGNHKQVGYIVRTPDWSKKDVEQDRFINIEDGVAEVWIKSKDPKTYYENPDMKPKTFEKLSATVIYNRYKKDYNNWKLKVKGTEKIYSFKKINGFGKADIQITGKELQQLEFSTLLLRNGKTVKKDLSTRIITKFDDNGHANIYINEDDKTVYYKKSKAQEKNEIISATIDDLKEITIETNKPFGLPKKVSVGNKKIKNIVTLKGNNEQTTKIKLIFEKELNILEKLSVKLENFGSKKVSLGRVVESKTFDEKFAYNEELGAIYSKEKTIFKVWAPTSTKVNLLIYGNDKKIKNTINMKRNEKGVYSVTLSGDKLGTIYNYEVYFDEKSNIAVDPYAKSTTINGEHSVVVNPEIFNDNFIASKNPIIYELHIRDLSISDDSGIKNKGKFLGLTEKGTKTKNGQITGLDYIKSLGITHVQLLPIYDFSKYSVDETNQFAKYNWGYDPVNYNTPEGSYSTDPNDPNSRIVELQQLVKELHKNDIGVIMDVVYNHVFSVGEHSFNKIVPNYFFRHNEDGTLTNGTGVGNDVASERAMARKFIIDSVKYWAKTYKLDGFRFDLMGILDIETMKKIREELLKINPNIIILGEGWDMGTLPKEEKAAQYNANKLPNIAFFNDDIRDGIKGSTFGKIGKGFVSGELNQEQRVINNVKGAEGIKTYTSANQLIQYVEAHDNLTLWDQLARTNSDESEIIRIKRHKLATSIVLLSQGIPFIHAGQEFARTKNGNENSYNASDEINKLDWNRAKENKDIVEYFKSLILIRKNHNLFNLKEYNEINKVFKIIQAKDKLIAYNLSDDKENIYVVHNSGSDIKEINIENGRYLVLVKDNYAKENGIEKINIKNSKIKISPISTLVIKKIK